jgi:hypothetical protein
MIMLCRSTMVSIAHQHGNDLGEGFRKTLCRPAADGSQPRPEERQLENRRHAICAKWKRLWAGGLR